MNLTLERTELLGKYLQEDVERAKKLLGLTPDEAVKAINADGYDFSIDELVEFGSKLQDAAKAQSENGELSESSLEDVAGGIGVIAGTLIALGAGILVGGMDRFQIW